MTDEQRREGERLRVMSAAMMIAARRLGFFGQSFDEVFGE
jgi:hypothetical protein